MVPVINSDQMRQEEKINAGYFQITKRNVKHFFFQISWYLRPNINFKMSVNCVRNNNCFEFILRMFFRVAWTFCGSFIFANGDNSCFVGKNHLSPYMTDSLVSLRVDIQLKGQKGRKEGNRSFAFFIISFFSFCFCFSIFQLLYSFTKRR